MAGLPLSIDIERQGRLTGKLQNEKEKRLLHRLERTEKEGRRLAKCHLRKETKILTKDSAENLLQPMY